MERKKSVIKKGVDDEIIELKRKIDLASQNEKDFTELKKSKPTRTKLLKEAKVIVENENAIKKSNEPEVIVSDENQQLLLKIQLANMDKIAFTKINTQKGILAPKFKLTQTTQKMIDDFKKKQPKYYEIPTYTNVIGDNNEILHVMDRDANDNPIMKKVKFIPALKPEETTEFDDEIRQLQTEVWANEMDASNFNEDYKQLSERVTHIELAKNDNLIALKNKRTQVQNSFTSLISPYRAELILQELEQPYLNIDSRLSDTITSLKNEMEILTHNQQYFEETLLKLDSILNKKKMIDDDRVNKYYENVSVLNRGQFIPEPQLGETPDQYYERLELNNQLENDEEILFKSEQQTNSEFRALLRELIDDESIIEAVTNSLHIQTNGDNPKYRIMETKQRFKSDFIKLFGIYNQNVRTDTIVTFCQAYYANLIGDPMFLKVLSEDIQIEKTELEGYIRVGHLLIYPFSEYGGENFDTLQIINPSNIKKPIGPKCYFKIVENGNDRTIVYSNTDKENTYIEYIVTDYSNEEQIGNKKPIDISISYVNIQKMLELPKTDNSLEKAIGSKIDVDVIINKFINDYNIVSVPAKIGNNVFIRSKLPSGKMSSKYVTKKPTYGWGIKNEEIPKVVPFGKYMLQLPKLHYKNIFSLRRKDMGNIPTFKSHKVSDDFVKLIMMIIQDKKPTKYQVENLSNDEQSLYHRALALGLLHKHRAIPKVGDGIVEDLKHKLKLIEEEIDSGNDNPLLINEMKNVLYHMVDLKMISVLGAKKHLKQFSEK